MQGSKGTSSVASARRASPLERRAFVGVFAAAVLLLGAGLANRDFWPPDEPRYGAIAEELRSFAHGWAGLVLLHSNGEVYTQKPPLYFWLAALAGAPAGHVSEAAARLPSALAGFGTLLLVAWLGRSMFGVRSGLLAALVLLTVPSWLQLATSARLDALLTAFVTLAFVAAWRIDRAVGDPRLARTVLHAAIGLGVLTKGPVALLLPALGVAAYLAWERRLGALRRFVSAPSALLSVAPGLLWVAASTLLAPAGYASASLWDNLVLRFFAGTSHDGSVWFYLGALPRGFLPWTLLWPAVWRRQRAVRRDSPNGDEARAWRFLLASAGAAVAFFSLSAGKRGVYLAPVYPLLAVACGEALARWLAAEAGPLRWPPPSRRAPLLAWSAGALVAAGLVLHLGVHPALNARNSQRVVAELARAATPAGAAIGVYRNETLAAAVGYYGGAPVRRLRDPPELKAFLAARGHTLVLEDDYLALLAERPVREVGRGRSRQRLFHVFVSEADLAVR